MKDPKDTVRVDQAAPPQEAPPELGRAKRLAFQVLAVLSLIMAFVGILVPGIPATEFILLCAWSSSKASPRIYRFLHENRFTGPPLYNWNHGRVITRRSKVFTTMSMVLCAVLLLLTKLHIALIVLCIVGMLCGNIWIWSRPETVKNTSF